MKRLLILFLSMIVAITLAACGETEADDSSQVDNDTEVEENQEEVEVVEENEPEEEEPREPTPQELMFANVISLIDEGKAFDTGSYIKGDVPKGEYAFVSFDGSGQYYSEEDSAGSIVDNENFDSFGYVHVHEAGNIQTDGALIKVESLEELEVTGAKELYEILNNAEAYKDAGWYKVGVDIEPGEYVIESFGSGYVGVMSGPVGNNEIVDNENFNGRYSVNVTDGQYLVISSGTIAE